MPLAHRALVDVPADDQLGARVDEPGEHAVAVRDRPLARPPRRADQLVVEDDERSAPGAAARAARAARASCASPTPPDWWRQGRTEFTPTTCTRRVE